MLSASDTLSVSPRGGQYSGFLPLFDDYSPLPGSGGINAGQFLIATVVRFDSQAVGHH